MGKKIRLSLLIVFVLGVVSASAIYLLRGNDIAVLNPTGEIAKKQLDLIIFTSALSLLIVIPVFAMTIYIVWKYRVSNTKKTTYNPDWDRSKSAEAVWWLIPLLLISVLAVVTWKSSHELDPYRTLSSTKKPITVQVIALQWKWLFIYPEQDIATVNFLQIPKDTPITFDITADAPMNSFWIPKLGGQVYAMSGMQTELHLLADKAGDYAGSSANISGDGFAGMKFTARASSQQEFDTWVQSTKASSNVLDQAAYDNLAKPSKDNPPVYYSSSDKGLYSGVMMKYMMPEGGHHH
jgi:cytochrome o ubiquinol oxidase subunit 2